MTRLHTTPSTATPRRRRASGPSPRPSKAANSSPPATWTFLSEMADSCWTRRRSSPIGIRRLITRCDRGPGRQNDPRGGDFRWGFRADPPHVHRQPGYLVRHRRPGPDRLLRPLGPGGSARHGRSARRRRPGPENLRRRHGRQRPYGQGQDRVQRRLRYRLATWPAGRSIPPSGGVAGSTPTSAVARPPTRTTKETSPMPWRSRPTGRSSSRGGPTRGRSMTNGTPRWFDTTQTGASTARQRYPRRQLWHGRQSRDPSFSRSGSEIRDLAIAADGRIFVAGQAAVGDKGGFLVACLMPNGSLDTNFGSGGLTLTELRVAGYGPLVRSEFGPAPRGAPATSPSSSRARSPR